MKTSSIFVIIIVTLLAVAGCSQKSQTSEAQSDDNPSQATAEPTPNTPNDAPVVPKPVANPPEEKAVEEPAPVVPENEPAVAEPAPADDSPVPEETVPEVVERKPFKFTVTSNLKKHYEAERNFDQNYDKGYTDYVKVFESGNITIDIMINTVDGKYPAKYDVDCDGDGEYEQTDVTKNTKCEYKLESGKHQIALRGDIPGLYLCLPECPKGLKKDKNFETCHLYHEPGNVGTDNPVAVLSIDDWGDLKWKSMEGFLDSCGALKIPKEAPDLTNVTDMSHAFYGSKINQPLNHWDVSNVTDMTCMFMEAGAFNQPLDKWNVSKVTGMRSMFQNAKSFNKSVDNWDVSSATNMNDMFYGAKAFAHYPQNWVIPEGTESLFVETKVENLADDKPLKTRKVSQ
ncbi:MAG: BspA family leucine-rich repeat surface protein [Proteobacteria bacterium]|nr:BspA family leucine-rich repeat surface protein [Pseudomonadota bacterium]